MSDFRRSARRKADGHIDVVDTMTGQVVGSLGDLSESGMLLIVNHKLVSDALYQFRLKLIDDKNLSHTLELGSHELWSDEAAAPGQIWAGFRFIDVSHVDLAYIRHWVAVPGAEYA